MTAFVTFHHISQLKQTLDELVRILRPGGYLILREHDCKSEQSLSAKYLNVIHAIIISARVGEFADTSSSLNNINQYYLHQSDENNTVRRRPWI